ncbi:hypothetical protein [Persicobacter psychrovividus]|uniref:Uncharacterized protein n=1 Tax=Persicobacter psychrovividus TaxID=387638 RepID=A0ABN6L5Z1_9BACT|nr:hypothetical protein PEPS_08710 [Persicobacter psychrovividus]
MIQKFKEQCLAQVANIDQERKGEIQLIAEALRPALTEETKLLFVDTHNSRSGIFAQIWAKCWAMHFGLKQLKIYSGGMKEESIHNNTINALNRAGLFVNRLDYQENARYQAFYHEGDAPVAVFSKLLDDYANPKTDFFAVVTSQAAKDNYPEIAGAQQTLSLIFPDIRQVDGTMEEDRIYSEYNLRIATELCCLMGMLGGQ